MLKKLAELTDQNPVAVLFMIFSLFYLLANLSKILN